MSWNRSHDQNENWRFQQPSDSYQATFMNRNTHRDSGLEHISI